MPTFTEDILLAPESEIVCYCSAVTKKEILEAIASGADSLQAIRTATGACTVAKCKEMNPRGRCCSIEIKNLLGKKIMFLNST